MGRIAHVVGHALRLQWSAAPGPCALLALSTVAIGISSPAMAWLSRALVDALTGTRTHATVAVIFAAALLGAAAMTTVMSYLVGYLAAAARQKLTIVVEQRLFARVAAFSGLSHFEDPAFHDRLQLAEEAAQEAPQSISMFVQEGARAAVTISVYLIAMLAIWPPIALLLIAAAVPAVIAQVAASRRGARIAEAVAGTYRRRLFYGSLLTDVRAAKEIRLFGLGPLLQRRMVDALTEASGAELAVQRRTTLVQAGFALLAAVVAGGGVITVVLGAVHGRFSVGDVTFFLAAVGGLQATFAGVVIQAGQFGKNLALFTHYLRITEQADDLEAGSVVPKALEQGIELSDVWFRYDDCGPWILQGVDLWIRRGSTVGLVGLNGAGKTTLLKLLCRFYDPDRGAIRWDGLDLCDLDMLALRRRIGVTFQDFMSYELTAQENIGLGADGGLAPPSETRRAACLAGIDDDLGRLPKGYETLLSRTFVDRIDDSTGVTLSGGQWQRVALARSLIRDTADLLILDEPSSGLDAEAEHRIHQTIARHGVGQTRVLISHRLAALRDADVIAVLAKGRIVEHGTHEELMTAGGEYARLFALQASGYQDPRLAVAQGVGEC